MNGLKTNLLFYILRYDWIYLLFVIEALPFVMSLVIAVIN